MSTTSDRDDFDAILKKKMTAAFVARTLTKAVGRAVDCPPVVLDAIDSWQRAQGSKDPQTAATRLMMQKQLGHLIDTALMPVLGGIYVPVGEIVARRILDVLGGPKDDPPDSAGSLSRLRPQSPKSGSGGVALRIAVPE